MNATMMMDWMNDIALVAAPEGNELEFIQVLRQILDSIRTTNLVTSRIRDTLYKVTHTTPAEVLRIAEC